MRGNPCYTPVTCWLRLRIGRGSALPLLALGVTMAIMVYTHFEAVQRIEVAYMISVKRTSLLFGILLGAWLFGERDLPLNLLAGSLMVLGVFLIGI